MGNKVVKQSSNKLPKIKEKEPERDFNEFILACFKYIGVTFTDKEFLGLKLKIINSEQYFRTSFDYFILYNSYLFQEKVHQIYDNYNVKIESCKKRIKTLICFDKENETDVTKYDFDSFLTVVLERLEIENYVFFDMTNMESDYINFFFGHILESIEMYKYNRKYENLYFLIPNSGFIVKNDSAVMFLTFCDNGITNSYTRLMNAEMNKSKSKDSNKNKIKFVEDFSDNECYLINDLSIKSKNEAESLKEEKVITEIPLLDIHSVFFERFFNDPLREKLISGIRAVSQIFDFDLCCFVSDRYRSDRKNLCSC